MFGCGVLKDSEQKMAAISSSRLLSPLSSAPRGGIIDSEDEEPAEDGAMDIGKFFGNAKPAAAAAAASTSASVLAAEGAESRVELERQTSAAKWAAMAARTEAARVAAEAAAATEAQAQVQAQAAAPAVEAKAAELSASAAVKAKAAARREARARAKAQAQAESAAAEAQQAQPAAPPLDAAAAAPTMVRRLGMPHAVPGSQAWRGSVGGSVCR